MNKTNNDLPKIVAIDFDGTLVEDKFPEIGEPNMGMFSLVKALQAQGVRVILWTSRDGKNLIDAVSYCHQKGIVFDAINTNIPEVIALYNNDTRKVFADLYIDDKAIPVEQDFLYWCHRLDVNHKDLNIVIHKYYGEFLKKGV